MTTTDLASTLYDLALQQTTARSKKYYLKMADELREAGRNPDAEHRLHDLIELSRKEIERAKAKGGTFFVEQNNR